MCCFNSAYTLPFHGGRGQPQVAWEPEVRRESHREGQAHRRQSFCLIKKGSGLRSAAVTSPLVSTVAGRAAGLTQPPTQRNQPSAQNPEVQQTLTSYLPGDPQSQMPPSLTPLYLEFGRPRARPSSCGVASSLVGARTVALACDFVHERSRQAVR